MSLVTTKQSRISWIDDARMFAMCCVVICHMKSAMNTPFSEGFSYWIVCFNMPMFVLLSGYLGYNAIIHVKGLEDFLYYIKKMALKIAFPTVVASSFISLIEGFIISSGITILKSLILLALMFFLYVMINKKTYRELAKWITIICIPISIYYCGMYWYVDMLLIISVTVTSSSCFVKIICSKTIKNREFSDGLGGVNT